MTLCASCPFFSRAPMPADASCGRCAAAMRQIEMQLWWQQVNPDWVPGSETTFAGPPQERPPWRGAGHAGMAPAAAPDGPGATNGVGVGSKDSETETEAG